MHMIYLPYSDDIRYPEEVHVTSDDAPRATDEQIKKASSLLKRIDLKDFSVCHIANPGVVKTIEEFKASVYGDYHDQEEADAAATKASRGEASKKRKAITDAASQKSAAYDWAELADNGKVSNRLLSLEKLKDMTVVELKRYLTAHSLPLSGKKEALISRILTHLGVEGPEGLFQGATVERFEPVPAVWALDRRGCRYGGASRHCLPSRRQAVIVLRQLTSWPWRFMFSNLVTEGNAGDQDLTGDELGGEELPQALPEVYLVSDWTCRHGKPTCIVNFSESLERAELGLRRALFVTVVGSRPVVLADEVVQEVALSFHLNTNAIRAHQTFPEDFLLLFPNAEAADRIYDGGRTARLGASYAEQLLRESCWLLRLHPDTVAQRDLSSFQLHAWCFTPDRIHHVMDLVIPEPVEPSDARASEKRALSYPVEITALAVASPSTVEGSSPPPPAVGGHDDHQRRRRHHRSRSPDRSAGEDTEHGGAPRLSVHARLGPRTPATCHVMAGHPPEGSVESPCNVQTEQPPCNVQNEAPSTNAEANNPLLETVESSRFLVEEPFLEEKTTASPAASKQVSTALVEPLSIAVDPILVVASLEDVQAAAVIVTPSRPSLESLNGVMDPEQQHACDAAVDAQAVGPTRDAGRNQEDVLGPIPSEPTDGAQQTVQFPSSIATTETAPTNGSSPAVDMEPATPVQAGPTQPRVEELTLVKEILRIFGIASGLVTNIRNRLIGLEKGLKKKICPWDPPVSDSEKTHPAKAALPRPSRAAWSPAYGQRPLPRIDGPTRTFGHPLCRLSERTHPAFTPSLSLSLRHRLCFRCRRCFASPGRHRPPEPEPSFWKQRRDDPTSLHLLPLHRAVDIGRSIRFFPGTDSRPRTVSPRRIHPEFIARDRRRPPQPHPTGETAPPASLSQEKPDDLLLRAPVKLPGKIPSRSALSLAC
ncbi:hypothetical protein PR202_ga28133 [Eleusine coracana subsp. coracana]|uniref:SAP domain-containing protein n=1 Tax=Eleusine coracana subsp. coracana TaxID=191504 RepID=A0AAV5DIF0_ELECO|nr:hypothetical protein PR202_ga28133 [Eleusine coracana subsp. coracana]